MDTCIYVPYTYSASSLRFKNPNKIKLQNTLTPYLKICQNFTISSWNFLRRQMLSCHMHIPWCWSPTKQCITGIVRKFGWPIKQAVEHPGLCLNSNSIWMTEKYLSKVNGNYTTPDPFELTHEFHVSKVFTPLSLHYYHTSGYCAWLNSEILSSYSKHWFCESQAGLFMSKKPFYWKP